MSEFRVNSITNQDGSAGPQVCGVSTFSGKSGVQIPSGSSEFRRQDGGGRGRGITGGGMTGAGSQNIMDFIEIATLGNAQDFGDLTGARSLGTAGSNATRAVIAGGYENPGADARVNNIDYVTIATTGNAVNFGDQSETRTDASAMPSSTRCVFGSGDPSTSRIDYIQFATEGNAIDFGDCTARDESFSGMSNAHGGL